MIFVQTKKGWLVGLGQEGFTSGRVEQSKISQKEWNRKEGRGYKDLKRRGGNLGQRVGTLKKWGWNPLTNYGLQMLYFLELCGEINKIYLK